MNKRFFELKTKSGTSSFLIILFLGIDKTSAIFSIACSSSLSRLSKDKLDLSVNNTHSGDGNESVSVKFEHDLDITFNSKYLIDVASELEGEKIEIFFNDTASPALIKDPSDFDSIFVIMPMKG